MSSLAWLFPLALPGWLGNGYSPRQQVAPLVGHWVATVPAAENSFVIKDGDTTHFKGRPAYAVAFHFAPDGKGSVQWGSAAVSIFTYRLINSGLVELREVKSHTSSRESFTIRGTTLFFRPYPLSHDAREDISLLYTLRFIKHP